MKLRLAHKLGIILISTVLISAIISAFIVSLNTRSAFKRLVRENDVLAARTIARSLEAYYAEFLSWDGVRDILENPFTMIPGQPRRGPVGPMGHMDHRAPMGHMAPRSEGTERRPFFRIVLADSNGKVLAHTFEENPPSELNRRVLGKGIELEYNGEGIGYLFVGSMIGTAFGPFQRSFLFNVYRSILLSSLIVGILFPLLGVVLIRRHITEPLQRLNLAAQQIASGEYAVRVTRERGDEIGELGRSFQRMADDLAAADEWKRKLIADSAHELRTPVSILQGNLEMMLDGVYPIDKERIRRLYSETELLERLVKELQELADAESTATTYQLEVLDINQLIESSALNFKSEAAQKSLKFDLSLPAESILTVADPEKMRQVWENIMKNAVRYSPSGATVSIEVKAESNGKILCACEDEGPGIVIYERGKVFERFYRIHSDRNRSTGGSGLGLAIVREIVNRHGGKVYFENPKVLDGARIVVELQRYGKN